MDVDRNRLNRYLLLAGALGLAALGQFYFFRRREYLWDGIIFWVLALVCFARLTRDRDRTKLEPAENGSTRARRWRMVMVGLAFLFNLVAARTANAQPPPTDYTPSALLWLLSLILFIAAWVDFPSLKLSHVTHYALRIRHYVLRFPGTARQGKCTQHPEMILVLALLLTGFLLRAWNLEHIPVNLGGDEGTQGMAAVDVLEGRLRNPFSTGWFTVPTLSFFAQAASLRLFGDSVAGLRTLSALVGTITLLWVYLLARRGLGAAPDRCL